jgi:hypothetical protein
MRVRSLSVLVNGRRVRVLHGNRSRVGVSLRGLPRGTVHVRVVVRGVRGGRAATVRDARTYRTCTPKRH